MSEKQIIISIVGPSTSGKSTLSSLLKPLGFSGIVSTTTRPQRTGEQNGIDYHFLSDEQFQNMLANEQLVEHAQVGKYFYGVSKQSIYDVAISGKSAVLVVEPSGANAVADFCKEKGILNHKVYLNNPIALLIERLNERYENDKNRNDDVYKDRLWNIGMIEPREWTAKAYSGEHHYDQIFDSFNLDNQQNIIDSIIEEVNKKLTNKNGSTNKRKF